MPAPFKVRAFSPPQSLAVRRWHVVDASSKGPLPDLDQARQVLIEPLGARGRRRGRVDAAARAAIDLHTWRALAPLGDAEAADLAAGLIELAANADGSD
jgi:hypothetical protein